MMSRRERTMRKTTTRGIQERLKQSVVLGAEGYVFELERRGYIKAGPYVPEVVLDFPEAVKELHREFLRAGSEVTVALTYYAQREKLQETSSIVRAMYEEQLSWAVEEGIDFVIAETNDYLGEALIALEVIKQL